MTDEFAGRVCAVTGGGSGLGEAICRALARQGGKLAAIDRDADKAAGVAGRLDTRARGYGCDVGDSRAVDATFGQVGQDLGAVDVLVNCAGIAPRRDLQERTIAKLQALREGAELPSAGTSALDDETWHRMLRVHVDGTFFCTRAALRQMEPRRRGAIVNMSAVSGLTGLAGSPDYSAAKGAIDAFTKSVAKEVAPYGIRVNAVAPGFVRTPMVIEDVGEQLLKRFLAGIPAGRLGEPEEVAALVVHLASDEAGYTTGQVISPNGGLYT